MRLGFALCDETLACIIRKSAPLFGLPFVSQIIGKEEQMKEIVNLIRDYVNSNYGINSTNIV